MLRVRNYNLTSSLIDEEISILNLADVHSDIPNLIDAINYAIIIKVDAITIAGDLFDSADNSHNEEVVKVLKRVKDIPIYISIGNHDLVSFTGVGLFSKATEIKDLKYFESLNEEDNIHVFFSNDDVFSFKSIEFISFTPDYKWYSDYNESTDEFKRIFNEYLKNNLPSSKFRIMLMHSCNGLIENNILPYSIDGINLVLSGHNHAGVMPDFLQKMSKKHRGLIGPYNKFFMTSCYGYWTKEKTSVILNNGLTKMGESHGGKFIRETINKTLKSDVDVISFSRGDEHSLKLVSKSVHK